MLSWIDAILQGVLLGGLYALFAAGLSLMFGIMRLVNLAHGDLIVLAAFVILIIAETLGANIFLAALIAQPVMFALGFALQRWLLNYTLGTDILPPLLVTFGISIVIQNGLLETFSAELMCFINCTHSAFSYFFYKAETVRVFEHLHRYSFRTLTCISLLTPRT